MKKEITFNTKNALLIGLIILLALAVQAQLWGNGDAEEKFIFVAKMSALVGLLGTYLFFLIRERDFSADAHYYYVLFSAVVALVAGFMGGGLALFLHWIIVI